jgi:tetratricopeptide (TPR) repeat protein
LQDRFGLPISTNSTEAAEHCTEGIDLLLSQNFGPAEKFQQALKADEGFALAHAGLAWVAMMGGLGSDAREAIASAQALTSGISDREKRQIEAISLWINNKGPQSMAILREHLNEYPRDAFMLRLAQRLFMQGCHSAGVPNFPEELFALCQSLEKHCSDDWAFLGSYAFANHETGRLEEAYRLAQKSLEMRPTNAVASHSVTHVFFEQGDAVSGGEFLGNWLEVFDKRASYHVHLSWHLALFELAMGSYQKALDRYEAYIRPSVVAKSAASLADSASFLWRLQLYCGTPPPKPWDEVRDQAMPAAGNPGPPFRDAHAALAFAAAGDHDALGKAIDGLRKIADQGNTLAKEMTLPLVQGIAAFAEGNYDAAVTLLETPMQQLERIGGSHAQREVFEDTLLEAYLRAEQFDKAEDMLRERLVRRASVRDTFWMGRVQASSGDTEPAKSTLKDAIDGWKGGDESSPELANLNKLAGTLS